MFSPSGILSSIAKILRRPLRNQGLVLLSEGSYLRFAIPITYFIPRRFDGILGLGFDTISVNHIVPPFYNMLNQSLLQSPVFSFRIGQSSEDAGEAVFGGIDHDAYLGVLHWVPVRRKAYWEVELEKVTLGNEDLELEDTGAAIDTGTSLIVVPPIVAEMIHIQIGAEKNGLTGQYTVDCSRVPDLPSFSLWFGGKKFELKGTEYVLDAGGICLSAFMGMELGMPGLWIIGKWLVN